MAETMARLSAGELARQFGVGKPELRLRVFDSGLSKERLVSFGGFPSRPADIFEVDNAVFLAPETNHRMVDKLTQTKREALGFWLEDAHAYEGRGGQPPDKKIKFDEDRFNQEVSEGVFKVEKVVKRSCFPDELIKMIGNQPTSSQRMVLGMLRSQMGGWYRNPKDAIGLIRNSNLPTNYRHLKNHLIDVFGGDANIKGNKLESEGGLTIFKGVVLTALEHQVRILEDRLEENGTILKKCKGELVGGKYEQGLLRQIYKVEMDGEVPTLIENNYGGETGRRIRSEVRSRDGLFGDDVTFDPRELEGLFPRGTEIVAETGQFLGEIVITEGRKIDLVGLLGKIMKGTANFEMLAKLSKLEQSELAPLVEFVRLLSVTNTKRAGGDWGQYLAENSPFRGMDMGNLAEFALKCPAFMDATGEAWKIFTESSRSLSEIEYWMGNKKQEVINQISENSGCSLGMAEVAMMFVGVYGQFPQINPTLYRFVKVYGKELVAGMDPVAEGFEVAKGIRRPVNLGFGLTAHKTVPSKVGGSLVFERKPGKLKALLDSGDIEGYFRLLSTPGAEYDWPVKWMGNMRTFGLGLDEIRDMVWSLQEKHKILDLIYKGGSGGYSRAKVMIENVLFGNGGWKDGGEKTIQGFLDLMVATKMLYIRNNVELVCRVFGIKLSDNKTHYINLPNNTGAFDIARIVNNCKPEKRAPIKEVVIE